MFKLRISGLLLVIALFGLGCSGGGNLVPVSGTISMPDKELSGLTVVFTPGTGIVGKEKDANPNVRSATGVIEAGGAFKLSTNSPGDGASPGKYRVTLAGSEFMPPDDPKMKGIPAIYFDPQSSPLLVEIKETGMTDLKLSIDPKATVSGGATDPLLTTPVGGTK